MTNIQDTLTYADGSPASGRLVIFWRPFVVSNVSVAGGELEFFIIDGHVALSLYANANALPVGSYYNAKYELENGAVYIEQWIVPNVPTANLGQVRVSFPPSPSVIISPLQLSSLNAQPGMFLMWDGNKWVPGYPSTFNLNPNYISVVVGTSGSDVNITGSPVALGGVMTVNVPDASATARGVVTTGTQSFTGNKTFLAAVNIPGSATIGNLTVTGTVTLPPNSYVPVSRKILTDATLFGGGDLSVDRTLGVVDDTSTQRLRASSAGTLVAARHEFNFISGANATIQVVEDILNNRINVTVGSLAFADPTTAKGDMLARSATALSRLAVGTNGQTLVADSAVPLGVKWATVTSGVSSVFGRTGVVVAQDDDYTVSQITGAVPDSRQILAGYGLTGGGDLSADRTLAVVDDTSVQRLQFALAGALKATRHRVNFIAGTGINLNLVDDTALNNQANLTITAVSTGAPSPSIYSVNGVQIGLQPELNLIAGSNITLAGVNQPGIGRVDVTINSTGGGPGTVTSVFGRTGAVVAQADDYTAAMVTNAVSTLGSYSNPSWITALAWTKISGAPAFVPPTRQVIAGAGLGGGGPLSTDVTLTANVVSVFGRTGAVVLTTADITTAGGVPTTRQILPGTGLSGGGDLSADRTLTVVNDTTTQRLRVAKAGSVAGTRPQINFIQGANITLTVADDIPAANQVNVTVAATTAGLADPTTTKGDLIVRGVAAPPTRLGAGADGWVLTADSGQALGVKWAVIPASPQTPWGSDIDGAGFALRNAGRIGVGNDAVTLPHTPIGWVHLIVGPQAPTSAVGEVTACANNSNTGASIGVFNFANYAITAVEKRIAQIVGAVDGTPDSGLFQFNTWNAGAPGERMRITAAGNVGIGTTNPGGQLSLGTSVSDYKLLLYDGPPAYYGWGVRANQFMQYCAVTAAMTFGQMSGATFTERMRITATGEVGIGTTNPLRPLTVNGATRSQWFDCKPASGSDSWVMGQFTSLANWSLMHYVGDDLSARLEVITATPTGNVGIGTTNPQTLLHCYKQTNGGITAIAIDNDATGLPAGQALQFRYGTTGVLGGIYHMTDTGSAWCLRFKVFNNVAEQERMTIIGSTGNVGIGTTNPQATLDVKGPPLTALRVGDAGSPTTDYVIGRNNSDGLLVFNGVQTSFSGYTFQVNNGTQVMTIRNTGNVGIGLNPSYKLDVAGDVNYSGLLRSNGTLVGVVVNRNELNAAGRPFNTVFQNPYGAPVFVSVTATINSVSYIKLLSDAGNPPSATVASTTNAAGGGTTINGTVSGWVMVGHFYKVETGGATLVSWFEWSP